MRCKNCGWESPAGKSKCEKCNAPLTGSMIDSRPDQKSGSSEMFNPRVTVNENTVFGDKPTENGHCPGCGYPVRDGMQVCPNCERNLENKKTDRVCSRCRTVNPAGAGFCYNCGYTLCNKQCGDSAPVCPVCSEPVVPEAAFCPGCGTKLSGKNNDFGRKTVLPGRRSRCTLTLIAEEKENVKVEPLCFSGEEIILNRDNTEQDNNTITSKEQAVLLYENKKWYIQDRSDLKTTFVHAGGRVELKSGDIIMLGDRRFEFDY